MLSDNPRYRIDTAPLKALATFHEIAEAGGLADQIRTNPASRYALRAALDNLIAAIERGDLDEDGPEARGRVIGRMARQEIPGETWDVLLDAYFLGALNEKHRPETTAMGALYSGLKATWTRFFAALIDYSLEHGGGTPLE